MDVTRYEQLLNGLTPTFEDFAGFVSVTEKLPGELLWKIINLYPNLNGHLKKVVLNNLQEKVVRENVDNALDAIASSLLLK